MDENSSKKIDLRIIVPSSKFGEAISKSINNFDFENKYNIIISSLIPTFNPNIVKSTTKGADIILIGAYENNNDYHLLYNELKNDFNHIEILNFSNIDFENIKTVEEEIKNSIIKAGLSFSLNNINISSYKNEIEKLKENYNNLLIDNEKIINENNKVTQDNKSLNDEISELHSALDEIKSDFSSFKSRFKDIYSKDILEIYNLNDLIAELFDDNSIDEEKIIIATNKFKPEDIIIGQGLIGAKSKEIAIDWLKIVKTALIFLENSQNHIKNELNSLNSSNKVDEPIPNDENFDIPDNFKDFW